MHQIKKTFVSACSEIVEAYREADQPWPAEARAIAIWAINSGHWRPSRGRVISQCARDLARAMREEYYTDPQGRHVRVKHAARYAENTEGGAKRQSTLWDDIRTSSHEHMKRAFALRRGQIVGECKQLKTDIDSYNDNNSEGKMIQTSLDFRDDVAEALQPTTYVPYGRGGKPR
jgi:hypothetical protein